MSSYHVIQDSPRNKKNTEIGSPDIAFYRSWGWNFRGLYSFQVSRQGIHTRHVHPAFLAGVEHHLLIWFAGKAVSFLLMNLRLNCIVVLQKSVYSFIHFEIKLTDGPWLWLCSGCLHSSLSGSRVQKCLQGVGSCHGTGLLAWSSFSWPYWLRRRVWFRDSRIWSSSPAKKHL